MKKESVQIESLQQLKTTDISLLVKLAGGLILPRVLDGFIESLDEKQRSAINKVIPAGGKKKLYFQLVDSPTPPIVIEMAQPLKISTMPVEEVRQQHIRGIRLNTDDIQLLAEGRTPGKMLKFLWRLKGQVFTILAISWMFMPLLRLGRSGLKDMGSKFTARYEPLLELVAR